LATMHRTLNISGGGLVQVTATSGWAARVTATYDQPHGWHIASAPEDIDPRDLAPRRSISPAAASKARRQSTSGPRWTDGRHAGSRNSAGTTTIEGATHSALVRSRWRSTASAPQRRLGPVDVNGAVDLVGGNGLVDGILDVILVCPVDGR